ncbi:MAG: WYL domain-containing protein [Alphaproteobacteria bacterium]|nr:MAG: WYL domain-containing protein [Alphaproteobacteria bacterium]
MANTIENAIHNKLRLRIYYPPGERIIEPHCYGIGSKGQHLLRAYQVSGASASHEREHWKLFRLDKMGDAEPNGETFDGPRPGYNPDDPVMKRGIIARL